MLEGYLRRALSAVALGLALAAFSSCGRAQQKASSRTSAQQQARNMAIPVGVAPVEQKDVPVFLTGLGSVQAYNTVTVKSRVDGAIVQVNFKEGQHVNKGALLAVIDPRPYEIALEQANAALQRDTALLNTSKLNLQRNEALAKAGVVAQQQLDAQRAETGQYEGTIAADQAAVNSAKLNLAYTRITAPVSGRAGLRQIDVGNIVHASDQNGLLVITQLQPVAVIFTLPEDDLQAVLDHMRKGKLPVEAWSRNDTQMVATGWLETVDNQIDPTTGTVKLKSVFANKDEDLWPNEFVNIHLKLNVQKNALVIPSSAIQRGPQGTFVYAVDQENRVQVRPVEINLTQGLTTLIASGLKPGERVVTDGQEHLQANALVDPRTPQPGTGNQQGAGSQGIGAQ